MQEMEVIISSLKKLNIDQIVLFGSRAKGNHQTSSDFDIAIKGKVDKSKLLEIKEKIEDKIFPYSIDIVVYDELDEKFKKIVDKTGKVIWKR